MSKKKERKMKIPIGRFKRLSLLCLHADPILKYTILNLIILMLYKKTEKKRTKITLMVAECNLF